MDPLQGIKSGAKKPGGKGPEESYGMKSLTNVRTSSITEANFRSSFIAMR